MNEKRMGGMKLGNFSGIKKAKSESTKQPEPTPEVKTETEEKKTETKPVKSAKSEAKVVKKRRDPASPSGARERSTRQTKAKKREQLVTVNIKIGKDQKEWLTDTASTIRSNNTEPVPPSERVYPQHLIGIAINLLQNVDVNWGEVNNIEELRQHLNL